MPLRLAGIAGVSSFCRLLFIIFAASVLSLASCSFLDVEPTVMVGSYESEEEALYGLAGVYGVINSEAFYGNYYSQMLSNVDDLCYYNRTSGNNFSVWYQHNASSSEIYEAWTEIYQGIGNANTFMEASGVFSPSCSTALRSSGWKIITRAVSATPPNAPSRYRNVCI